jgi:membrane protein YqaA with SNARE-associated domain
MPHPRHLARPFLIIGSYVSIVFIAFLTANYLVTHPEAGEFLARIGYPGVFIVAFIAGINLFPPIPAAAITPLLTTAGLHIIPIIIALSLGTLLADSVAYFYGAKGGESILKHHPAFARNLRLLTKKHHPWVPFVLFLYAAVVPLPNEIMIIPLAMLGTRFRSMVIPLLIGDFVSQAILAVGIQHIFDVWM